MNEYVPVEQQNNNLDIYIFWFTICITIFFSALVDNWSIGISLLYLHAELFLYIDCNCFFIYVNSSIKLQLNIIISSFMLYFSCTCNWSVRGFINNIIINTFIFRTFFRILFFVSTITSEEVLLLVLTAFHHYWNLDIWYRFIIWYFFETCCFFIAFLFLHGAAGFLWVIFLVCLVVCVMDLVFYVEC